MGKDLWTQEKLSGTERVLSGIMGALEFATAYGIAYKGIKNIKATSTSGLEKASGSKGVGNPVETAGKGNTGRTIPNYLDEQMAMHEVQSNPLKNAKKLPIKMTDPRWLAKDGWVKMQKNIKLSNGKTVSVHYVYNKITGVFDDFKFK